MYLELRKKEELAFFQARSPEGVQFTFIVHQQQIDGCPELICL